MPTSSTLSLEYAALAGVILMREAYSRCFPYLDTDGLFSTIETTFVWEAVKEVYSEAELQPSYFTIAMRYHADTNTPLPATHSLFHTIFSYDRCSVSATLKVAKELFTSFRARRIPTLVSQMEANIKAGMPYSEAEQSMQHSLRSLDDPASAFQSAATIAQSLSDIVARNAAGQLTGIPTGFRRLDAAGGFHPGDLVIIGAESSQGKTSLALSFVLRAITQQRPVAFYSMEMTASQLMARLFAMTSSTLSASDILYRQMPASALQEVAKLSASFQSLPLYVDESATTPQAILTSARQLHSRFGIQIVVVDYLQILNATARTRNTSDEQFLGDTARSLKDLAKSLSIVVIALSQLRRDTASPVPTISRLRASGQIAEAADQVMLLYRPEAVKSGKIEHFPPPFEKKDTHNAAEIILAKNRNGALCEFTCGFLPEHTLFFDTDLPDSSNPLPDTNPDDDPDF